MVQTGDKLSWPIFTPFESYLEFPSVSDLIITRDYQDLTITFTSSKAENVNSI